MNWSLPKFPAVVGDVDLRVDPGLAQDRHRAAICLKNLVGVAELTIFESSNFNAPWYSAESQVGAATKCWWAVVEPSHLSLTGLMLPAKLKFYWLARSHVAEGIRAPNPPECQLGRFEALPFMRTVHHRSF
jgi:hypothetical protein